MKYGGSEQARRWAAASGLGSSRFDIQCTAPDRIQWGRHVCIDVCRGYHRGRENLRCPHGTRKRAQNLTAILSNLKKERFDLHVSHKSRAFILLSNETAIFDMSLAQNLPFYGKTVCWKRSVPIRLHQTFYGINIYWLLGLTPKCLATVKHVDLY